MKNYLSINNLSFEYPDGYKALNNISLNLNEKERLGILGPNGAGKTTTFYTIAGLIKSDKGKIFLGNEDLTKLPMHERSKLGIKYLPQEPSIFLDLTVKENLLGLAELSYNSEQKIKDFLDKSIEDFGLQDILKSKGRQLSGGQRRKVEIARTLAADPKIILLDEPFAGIDPIAVEEIKELLLEISKKNISILITDHNVRETLSLCNRAIILNEGSIIAEGNEKSLKENSYVQKKYFGKLFS